MKAFPQWYWNVPILLFLILLKAYRNKSEAFEENFDFHHILPYFLERTLSHCSVLLAQDTGSVGLETLPRLLSNLSQDYHDMTLLVETGNFSSKFKGRTIEYKRNKGYCSVILSFVSEGNFSFHKNLISHLPNVVKKDQDYFIYVTTTDSLLDRVLTDNILSSKVKHRIGLSIKPFEVKGACFACSQIGGPQPHKIKNLATVGKALLFNQMKDMGGRNFRVSTPLSTRWLNEMFQTPQGNWVAKRGPYKLVLNLLQAKLNFSTVYFPSTGGGTGAIINGSWVGTVGDILSEKAELGHVTALNYLRYGFVAPSFPISQEWLTFCTGNPRPYFSWRAIYRPLALNVWPLVLISMGVGVLCFYLLFALQPNGFHLKSWSQKRRTLRLMFDYVLGTILDQEPMSPDSILREKYHSQNASGALRVFIIFWLCYALLISTAYRSKLVTFLVFPELEEPPSSFEELANSHFKIGLQYIKGAAYQVLKTSKNPTYVKIFKRMSLEENDVQCFLSAANSRRFACISWDSIAEFIKHRNLTDKYGQSPVQKSSSSTLNINAGLIMEKRAIFKEEIDHILRWITDMGILIKIRHLDFDFIRVQRNEWLRSTGREKNVYGTAGEGDKGANVLGLSHFSGSFYSFGICITFSIFAFWMETLHAFSRVKRKKAKEKNNDATQLTIASISVYY